MDFTNILKGQCANQLDNSIKNAQLIGRKQIDRFCSGLMKGILAVKNAIAYNWTNGLVAENVNRLKIKNVKYTAESVFNCFKGNSAFHSLNNA